LVELIQKVKPAVPGRATIPVLTNILLEAKDGRLTATGYDLEVGLISSCPAQVKKAGRMLIPCQSFEQLVKALTATSVTLYDETKVEKYETSEYRRKEDGEGEYVKVPRERRQTTIKLEADKSVASFPGHDPKDYPAMPKIPRMTLRFTDLAKAIPEVLYAAAKEDTRPVLNGICFNPKKRMELAAADGFRLAITTTPFTGKLSEPIIILARACKLLTLMPGKIEAGLAQGTGVSAIVFVQKGLTLMTQLIQGEFPKYDQLVPTKGSFLRCSAEALREAIRQVGVVQAVNKIIRLRTKGHTLLVSMKQDDATVEAKVSATGKAQIAFDVRYLTDLLKRMDGTFAIRITDGQSPAVAKVNGSTHVLMPHFVDW